MTNDMTRLSAAELTAVYRSKAFSPSEVAKAVIELLQLLFNAYRVIDAETALKQARAANRAGSRFRSIANTGLAPATLLYGFHCQSGSRCRKSSFLNPDERRRRRV